MTRIGWTPGPATYSAARGCPVPRQTCPKSVSNSSAPAASPSAGAAAPSGTDAGGSSPPPHPVTSSASALRASTTRRWYLEVTAGGGRVKGLITYALRPEAKWKIRGPVRKGVSPGRSAVHLRPFCSRYPCSYFAVVPDTLQRSPDGQREAPPPRPPRPHVPGPADLRVCSTRRPERTRRGAAREGAHRVDHHPRHRHRHPGRGRPGLSGAVRHPRHRRRGDALPPPR